MSSTSKPKLTMADKCSMKALQRFTQTEMKEHDCYLANKACLKGRDNQNNFATWQEMHFQGSLSPSLNFVEKSSLDGCN